MSNTPEQEVLTKLMDLLYVNFPLTESMKMGPDEAMLESGAIDSLGLLTIIAFIEKEFAIKVDDFDVVTENFGTARCLARYVVSKRSSLT